MKNLKAKNIIIIISIYLLISILLMLKNISFYKNIINPCFWILLLIYIYFYQKQNYVRSIKNKKYLIYAIIISLSYLSISFYTGFFLGFTKNPYSQELITIFKNIIVQIIPIIGIEKIRNILILKNKNNKVLIFLITILLIALEINYNTFINLLTNNENFFKYLCSNLIPLISSNILYSYLSLKESNLSLIFRILDRLYILLLPILPYTDWFIIGTLTIIKTTMIYVLFKYKFKDNKQNLKNFPINFLSEPHTKIFLAKKKIKDNKKNLKEKHQNFIAKINYAIALIFATTLVCFMLGLFKYEAIAILSSSMNPIIERGDLLIYEKRNEEDLNNLPNDTIIIYKLDKEIIVHRIVGIYKEKNQVYYITKGDSNNQADNKLVSTNQIKGIYKYHFKYLGYPSVILYKYFNYRAT